MPLPPIRLKLHCSLIVLSKEICEGRVLRIVFVWVCLIYHLCIIVQQQFNVGHLVFVLVREFVDFLRI